MKHKTTDEKDELHHSRKSKQVKSSCNVEEEPRPGPSSSTSHVRREFPPNFDFTDSDSEDEEYDRESLIKNIDADLRSIISR